MIKKNAIIKYDNSNKYIYNVIVVNKYISNSQMWLSRPLDVSDAAVACS